MFKGTSGQSNLTEDRIAATDARLNRIHQVVPMCPPVWAHWRHLANTMELVRPSAHPSPKPNSKLIGLAVSAQLTAVPILYSGRDFAQNYPFSSGDLDPV